MIVAGLGWFFFILAAFFAILGTLGVLFMPDVYSRLQAGALSGTTAVVSLLIGSIFWVDPGPFTGRLVVLLLFFLVSSPTATHIIGRYAWRERIIPWRGSR
ncbi:multisubunit sodium/proton antiporter, MrpG subunit [Alkalispirochaeta americana]|uniref:Multisubunit sodium/proton antiporter, MrpG subunit n=1 Tax=Alkalispirochaeta americana TaxID=159291 RepID=A0A1N6T6A3_9SPIO|nr:monovalent cation/H(+) antiporter subunit G [Alkalispirochaeta americana]SIQ48843.1 multisubunit sodium/proton antiporter, MrpG subunit [Alkalispirochaeta americana]